MRTREEHLAEAKKRALKYVDAGDLAEAVKSMCDDLQQRRDLGVNAYMLRLGMMYYDQGDPSALRRWIEGFR